MNLSARLARLSVPLVLIFGANATAIAAPSSYTVRSFPLPAAGAPTILMDYIAFDPATGFVWAPAGNTGAVDVVDSADGKLKQVVGFPTAEMGSGERKRMVGPSSVTIGEGRAYIGNRGDSSVCSLDARTLVRGACHRLDSMPDGIAYVAPTKEVWVTTPRDKSVRVLDASTLDEKAKLSFEGNPEGFAVDPGRGRFYTNLEDKDRTLAIDLKTRKTVATWNPACGEDGPHGLRADAATGHLFVACSTRAEVLDAAHDGRVLSTIETGDGVDDIDYAPSTHLLYVGAARAGKLTVARDDSVGKLVAVDSVEVPKGARNPAVTDKGVVYLAHGGSVQSVDLVVATPAK